MSIDKILFTLYSAVMIGAASIFDFLMELALKGVNIIPGKAIDNIMEKVYILLSVVMLFYMAITLLTYLVSPNKLTDSSKGGPKIIVKIIVTLVLLIFTPTLFDLAQDLQTAILSENVIGKIILSQDNSDTVNLNKSSDTLVYGITRAILKPKENAPNKKGDVDRYYAEVFFDTDIPNKVGELGSLDKYAANKADFDFNPIVGLLCGVVVILVLFGFCFDIAIRIVKLAALKIIAPFPIITNMLPSEKNSKLPKYGRECISTYAILFIDIGLVDFGVYLIEVVDLDFRGVSENWLIVAMFYVGLLLFLKQAPKLFGDIFGVKVDGNFTMNPMKRIREVPVLGSAVQTAGAAAGGLVQGVSLGFKAGGIGSALKMGGLGLLNGGRAGFKQTKFLGVAAKDQKIEKNAYRTGASSVAQAITGNSDASAGFPDRMFNRIGTQLNKSAYEMQKAIDKADKNVDKANELLATAQDNLNEIQSKYDISDAKLKEIQGRETTITSQISAFTASRLTNRATLILNENTRIDNEISDIQTNRNSILADATADVDGKISQANRDYYAGIISPAQHSALISQYTTEKENITQSVENSINEKITNLQIEKTNLERTVDNKLDAEYNTLIKEQTSISTELSEARAEHSAYATQLATAKADVVTKTKDVAYAKTELESAKDKKTKFEGDFHKNK